MIFIMSIAHAQTKSVCFTDQQLLFLQKSSRNDVIAFLKKEGWSNEKVKLNQTKQYFDYQLDYNIEKWEQKTSSFYEGTIYYYYKEGLPNLIIYHSTNSCFNSLKDKRSTVSVNGYNFAIITIKDVTIELRNYLDDRSDKR